MVPSRELYLQQGLGDLSSGQSKLFKDFKQGDGKTTRAKMWKLRREALQLEGQLSKIRFLGQDFSNIPCFILMTMSLRD